MLRSPLVDDNEDSQSTVSSIAIWLDGHPKHYEDYAGEHSPSTLLTKTKRTTRSRAQQYSAPNKRGKLVEIPVNSMDSAQHPPRRTSPRKGPTTRGRELQLQEDAISPSTPTHYDPSRTSLDQDQTPMPKSLGTIPPLDPCTSHTLPPPPYPALRSADSLTSRSFKSQETSDISSTRSRSPTKRMADFQLSDVQVEMRYFGPIEHHVLTGAQGLYRDLRRIDFTKKVIPLAVKDKVAPYLDCIPVEDMNFADDGENGVAVGRNDLGHDAIWAGVVEILDAAKECSLGGYSESAWNSEVHSRLLRLTLDGGWRSKGVWYCDITTAKIHDSALLPRVATGAVMSSKMVDYALCIDLNTSSHTHERIIERLRAEGKPSINHTAAEYVRFKPIAVSIETKRGNLDEDGMYVQLGVWLSAHFARLRQLTGDGCRLPALPVVIVQGHNWSLMIAEVEGDQKVVILKELRLGATDSVLGIYQIIACIRRLARWVQEEYLPWFESNVLV